MPRYKSGDTFRSPEGHIITIDWRPEYKAWKVSDITSLTSDMVENKNILALCLHGCEKLHGWFHGAEQKLQPK